MSRRFQQPALQPLPIAIEAEQALIGALLCDNTAFAKVPPTFGAEHFGEPFHARLFVKMRIALERGQPVDQAILSSSFSGDSAFEDLGGIRYLTDLLLNAPPGDNAPSYAHEIMQTAVRRGLIEMARDVESRARDPGEDPLGLLSEAGAAITHLHAADSQLALVSSDDAMDAVLDFIDNPGAHASGILTGLEPLDTRLGAWQPEDLIVLGARPGMGKSAVAAIIAQNVARGGGGVIEIHAEMSVQQAWRRRLTATAYSLFAERAPAYSSIRKRTISFDEREMLGKAREALRGIPLHAVKKTGITLSQLRALVLRQRAAWERQGIPLALISIDHVGLVRSDREYENRTAQQTEISNGLKALAGDLKVPVLALAQLSRQVESRDDKHPTLPDLRDSGSWEQDADVVLGAYREAYYAAQEKEPPMNGPKGQLAWDDWDRRRKSPWIDIGLLKVREGEQGNTRLWAHMPTNTILGQPPEDSSFFGGI